MAAKSPRANTSLLAPALAIAALLTPSVIWNFWDKSVWPWDQGYYAELALRIAHSADDGVVAWLTAKRWRVAKRETDLATRQRNCAQAKAIW